MLIASAFKRSVMWSSAGFVQVGRSNQLFLLLINITWSAIISLLSSLFIRLSYSISGPSLSLLRFFFYPFQYIPLCNSEVKIFSISSLLMARPQSYRRTESKEFVKREPTEERDTRDERRAFNFFYRNENSLCAFNQCRD